MLSNWIVNLANALLFLRNILHLVYSKHTQKITFRPSIFCSKPLFITDHWTRALSLRKFPRAFGARSAVYSLVNQSWLCQRTGLWLANWKSKQAQRDVQHESTMSVVRKEVAGRRGLGRTQPVPRCHHFLWMSHCVLPLLHSLWDRAIESQLNLPQTEKEATPQFVANNLKTFWFWLLG